MTTEVKGKATEPRAASEPKNPAVSGTKAPAVSKPAGQTGVKPGPKPSVERPALDLGKITVSETTRETIVRHRRTKGERDPEQIHVDKIVEAAHKRWVEAGKPEEWLDSKGLKLRVPAGQMDTLVWRIQKSGTHLGLAIRLGKPIRDGEYAETVLVVKDKPVKDAGEDADSGGEKN